ncbi:MAG: type II toxin-antitoxin system PemK/MazF family toxin [Proteobacteria bacterium]|uniref:type II toxin-antitoxin system PemK/MazF family toxin n=1 Tax=Rudaea sp. TaxID=2136325 RepID=UPI003783286C|nr:type II toxin-antitoxin system PemK/MazF family toxin [Pseudomonadota bacterium]
MKRGDIVTVAASGDYGKPRPAVIVQADAFDAIPSVTVMPLTSEIRDDVPLLRISVKAGERTGLRKASQIMIDKTQTLLRAKVGRRIGNLDAATLRALDRALAVFFGVGEPD